MDNQPYLPNSWSLFGSIYHVAQNHPDASDDNPGTQEKPFKTVAKAGGMVDLGDVVIIADGIYREEISLVKGGGYNGPNGIIRFIAPPGKRVYIKGSDEFKPVWEKLSNGGNLHQARLPDKLFDRGMYNPYELSLDVASPGKVRPMENAGILPETLGQIYFDGKAYRQVASQEEVRSEIESFIVSADGCSLIVHLPDRVAPGAFLVELTVRRRCFRLEFSGTAFVETGGIVVEHAAEPEPFCKCRPISLRGNRTSGLAVRKTRCLDGTSDTDVTIFWGNMSYAGVTANRVMACAIDDTVLSHPLRRPKMEIHSEDDGKTWRISRRLPADARATPYSYYLDAEHDILVRHHHLAKAAQDEAAKRERDVVVEFSRDAGATWSEPCIVATGFWFYDIRKLRNGELLWMYGEHDPGHPALHQQARALIGTWRRDQSAIAWAPGGSIRVAPETSMGGLAEPRCAQLSDGRILVLLRAGARIPSQHHPGASSVKLYSVSNDNGATWSVPKPLCYEDGQYVYSPRSYHDVFRSVKNGRIYAIMNMIDEPSYRDCDPRLTLQIAEINPDNLGVVRDSVTVIEQWLPGHHHLVRFSNWQRLESRATGNPLLFFKLHVSEYSPIRNGYDYNGYRYEIILPDRSRA